MVSRRIFLQGLTGVAAALATGVFSKSPVAAQPASPVVTIDSVETPIAPAKQALRHIRLSGPQLERYKTMRSLFGSPSELRIVANIDHATQVLLEAALNEAGRAVVDPVRHGASYSVVVKAA